jgi:uncharacterized protein Usg
MASLWTQMNDRVLTTAEILYHFPDYPMLLQQYLWQDYDAAPQFPNLRKFILYWNQHLDGKVHSVRVTRAGLIIPGDIKIPVIETTH